MVEIEDEIKKMGKRYDGKQTANQILTERLAVWQELQAFHDIIDIGNGCVIILLKMAVFCNLALSFDSIMKCL